MPLRRVGRLVAALAATAVGTAGLVSVQATVSSAAAADPEPLPQTVRSDSLPTVQINGVVWDQQIVGDTVYVGGEFTQGPTTGRARGHE